MLVLLFLLVDSPVIITEVMSNVKGSESGSGSPGDRNEFVEIYNLSSDTIDLVNYLIYDFDVNADEIYPWEDDSILINYPDLRINSTLIYPCSYALILDREYTSSDTTGGNVQPYNIPDSTLILTTDDTTIGNGLQSSDPLIMYSIADACTTSFGTPYDTLDDFPSDPGDGISWERIDLNLPDTVSNWLPCMDSSGCTPGKENSTTNAFDLALETQSIILTPASLKTGEDVNIEIRVKNLGLREVSEYELLIFDDENNDSIMNANELLIQIDGDLVYPSDSVSLFFTFSHPSQGMHNLGFKLDFSDDINLENNLVFKELIVSGEIGELALSPRIFTPDNDGINDRLQIDYRLPKSGGLLTLLIFDTRGKLLHNVCKKEPCSATTGTIFWNGEAGAKKIPSGMYIVYLEYRYQGSVTKAKKTTVLAR
ncbi:gliding motility-associated C-terminal domain-containing protein [candidate division WOR-3 bacterium]|nr:gliding motility-associated C-terminal domain-containing protein [candidate division WOR-3 bacterium]